MPFLAKVTSSRIWVAIPVNWDILHWYACGADGRSLGWALYGHMITKFSRMGRLLHFLTHGAPLAHFARESSSIFFLIGYVESHYSRVTQWLASKRVRALICFLEGRLKWNVWARSCIWLDKRKGNESRVPHVHLHFSHRYSSSYYSSKILPTNKRKRCGLKGQTLDMFSLK